MARHAGSGTEGLALTGREPSADDEAATTSPGTDDDSATTAPTTDDSVTTTEPEPTDELAEIGAVCD